MSERVGIWARIMVPIVGGDVDAGVLHAAEVLAAPFDAELAAIFTPADIAEVMPWMGEGFMGGIQVSAIETLKEATAEGERFAREVFEACPYRRKTFTPMVSPIWSALAMESRLSDVVVFDDAAGRGRGPLAETFQQMVADEQRPVLVARRGLRVSGCIAVAWDGGKEASRAVRTALPLLQLAERVVILSATGVSSRAFDPQRLKAFLAARGVEAQVEAIEGGGDVGRLLIESALRVSADLLVAGAFGHPRLQEFIFGGATRSLLSATDAPSLFLSH